MAKTKSEQNIPSIQFRTGILRDSLQPIYLGFVDKSGKTIARTIWNVTDAEAMGYSLIKMVELYRREQAKLTKPLFTNPQIPGIAPAKELSP